MTTFLRFAAICLLSTTLLEGVRGGDACTTVSLAISAAAASGRSILKLPPSQIAACYDTFPLNPEVQKATLAVLSQVLDVYAFTDYLKSSPSPTFQPSLSQDFLFTLTSRPYSKLRDFYEAIQDVLFTARDGHLSYNVQCFSTFTFLQPLYLTSSIVKGQPALYIHSFAEGESYLNLEELVGARVIQIDGIPAIAAIQAYADSQGISKDENTRFTRMLASKTWAGDSFKVIRGAFATRTRPPPSDTITLVVELGDKRVKTVKIPWLVKAYKPANWNDTRSYWDAVCSTPPPPPPSSSTAASLKRIIKTPLFVDLASSKKVKGIGKREAREGAAFSKVGDPVPFAAGTGYAFFSMAKGNKVGIFKLTSFPYTGLEAWLEGIKEGFKRFKKMSIDHVILDLADNVGGSLCAAMGMLRVISTVTSMEGEFRPFLTDIRLGAEWAQNMTQLLKTSPGSAFSGATYLNPNTGKSFSPGEWTHFEDKKGQHYTPLFMDNCESIKQIVTTKFKEIAGGWDPKNVALVTNGVCLSSCSLLHHAIHETSAIPTVAVYAPSGTNKLISPSSATGGMAYSAAALMEDLKEAKMPVIGLPLAGDFSFTLREAFSRIEPEMPLEYRRVIADYDLPYNLQNVLEVLQLWKDVAAKVWSIN